MVTFDPPGQIDEFTRSVGWCSLAELPRHYREADICLVPTIAQDSLSRTSVEAMASGIPVVASRIGGLPYTVTDGITGLLCEPSDPVDLARQIARLLDDQPLRRQMGLAGRKRFEQDFVWETVIERHFRPLLGFQLPRGTNDKWNPKAEQASSNRRKRRQRSVIAEPEVGPDKAQQIKSWIDNPHRGRSLQEKA